MPALTLEDNDIPFACCANCGGPIWTGNPVISYEAEMGGWLYVHKFSITCEQTREDRAKAEANRKPQ